MDWLNSHGLTCLQRALACLKTSIMIEKMFVLTRWLPRVEWYFKEGTWLKVKGST